ncbi:hypothetical protein [Rhodohalobacter mucosus]|uniref:Uncharacterized protein n=1 Tax=Rhodohalobacter mucosus TaxID=2079485 RepID=A0A316TP04_9BACT|nr:hypothetical protein [Rhodohalobacter mucosus]PWN06343.1 hypothetical protein DDZ15_11015 [Rhodohalobacter mucosus]
MKRNELENRINDAADGLLTDAERVVLERELEQYPDLMQDYRDIMALPDISGIYGTEDEHRDASSIRSIRERLIEHEPFSMASVFWFKKFALAASLLILTASSLAGFLTGAFSGAAYTDAITADELIYPQDPSFADEYVSYISDWPGEGGIEDTQGEETNTTGAQ